MVRSSIAEGSAKHRMVNEIGDHPGVRAVISEVKAGVGLTGLLRRVARNGNDSPSATELKTNWTSRGPGH